VAADILLARKVVAAVWIDFGVVEEAVDNSDAAS
tara:strand:+ start:1045 stop:1146 length:102 start_codon:yes stop_codon:yes gene_type:complete